MIATLKIGENNMIVRDWTLDDVDCGIEIPEFYDGVSVWSLKDGRYVNRWAGVPGYEVLASRVDAWLHKGLPE